MRHKPCPTCDHALNLVDVHAGGSVRHCPRCGTLTVGGDKYVPTSHAPPGRRDDLLAACRAALATVGELADLVAGLDPGNVIAAAGAELTRRQLAAALASAGKEYRP